MRGRLGCAVIPMPKDSAQRALARKRSAFRRGHLSERFAAWALRLAGYRILARRYRTKVGEIDLIARRGGVVAFVEVKRRNDLTAGLEAVTPQARTRIRRAAELYVRRNPALAQLALRFDVIVITPWAWPRHIVDAWRDC
jgi:putative endonuclease